MTIARPGPATELGLRPTPPSSISRGARRAWILPVLFFLLGIILGLLRLSGPKEDLYPLAGDSAQYHAIAQGFAKLYSQPIDGLRLWASRSATAEDLSVYGFDSWVLQHAPAYTAYLGIGYLISRDDEQAGRYATVLLYALGALFLYLLTRLLFGGWAALGAVLLYLFWPANWVYGTAVLTEVPVAAAGLATAYLLLRTASSEAFRSTVLGGVVLGILVLTKTTLRYVAIPIILLELLLDRRVTGKQRLRRAGGRVAGWGGVQLLWLLFLWGFQLSPNPLAHTGDNWLWVYRGNYVPDRGWETIGIGDATTPELIVGSNRAASAPRPERRLVTYKEAFLETLRRYPSGVPILMLSKAAIFWRYPAISTYVRSGFLDLPPPARLQPIVAVLALLGLALCVGLGRYRLLPAALPLYLTLLHAATHLVGRYNVPALPFAFLYASGFFALAIPAGRDWWRRSGSKRTTLPRARLLPEVIAAIVGIICWMLTARSTGPLVILGPWLFLIGFAPFMIRLLGGGRLGVARALVFLLPIALLSSAGRANDPDSDEGRIRLTRPGDGVRLALSIPPDTRPEMFVASELALDLLPSTEGEFVLSVRVNGREVSRIDGRPQIRAEDFLLDPEIHGAQDRYRRVLRSVDRHLQGNPRKNAAGSAAGYDLYRQWHRIDVPPAIAFADPNPVLEVVLVESRGGTVTLFADRTAAAGAIHDRTIEMPAFLDNAYELSSYRFDAYATDRYEADARLTRPIRLQSIRRGAEFFDAEGKVAPLRGEPRIRLRGRLHGGLGLVRRSADRVEPAFVSDSSRVERMLSPAELRRLRMDRDRYFDGMVSF